MKKARKSIILKVLIHLLMCLIIILGFNGYNNILRDSPYRDLETVEESSPFQSTYLKYVERVAEYIQYCEKGYETKLINETDYSVQSTDDLYSTDDESYNQSIFDFYHRKLNIDETNFLYYVINTTTGEEFFSPYFYSNGYNSEDTVDPSLLDANLKNFMSNIKSYNAYLTLNTETGVYGTNIKSNVYINASNLGWVANCITQKLSTEDFNNKATAIYDSSASDAIKEDIRNQELQNHLTGNVDTSAFVNKQYMEDSTEYAKENNYLIYTATLNVPLYSGDSFLSYHQDFGFYKLVHVLLPCIAVVFVLLFILSVVVCGHSKKTAAIRLNFFDRIYTEIGALIIIVMLIMPFYILIRVIYENNWLDSVFSYVFISMTKGTIIMNILVLFMYSVGMFGLYSLIRRIKARTIFTNSVIYVGSRKLLLLFKIFIRHSNLTFTTVAFFLLFVAANVTMLLVYAATKNFIILCVLFVIYVAIGILLIKFSADLDFVIQESKKISEGDLNHQFPSDNLIGPIGELGNSINKIGSGLSVAVDEKLKSERMKTELITNVSHDIKTPLTSIINYVDLLKKQSLNNETAKGYLEVLETKSWRLKTLIEDLVEASKASTGTIPLNLERLNLVELVRQSLGEFEDRFVERKLEAVLNVSDEPIYILADGRSTFRIIENVFSNVNKYALGGTRIYIDAIKHDGLVTISVKNISANKLNITADELMERFVRGDISRNTEGSGLGLSIARSLAALQNGTFDIILDGDLFKACFTFTVID